MVNVTLLIKALFHREATPELVFLTLVSASVYAAVAIAAAVHVFHRETVLVGGRSSLRTVFERRRRRRRPAQPGLRAGRLRDRPGDRVLRQPVDARLADPRDAASSCSTAASWRRRSAMIALFGFDGARDAGAAPPPLATVAARRSCSARPAWLFAGGLGSRLLPPPESLTRAMQRLHPARRRPDAALGGVAGDRR